MSSNTTNNIAKSTATQKTNATSYTASLIVFVGFVHNPKNNRVHLLTQKDVNILKLKKNPVNEWAKNQPSFIRGIVSVGGGLYGFGDWIARRTGFRDYQLGNIKNEVKKQTKVESAYMLRLLQAIILNEHGAGEIFIQSFIKYSAQNKSYVAGRFLTSVGVSYITTSPIGLVALFGDVAFTAKQIDELAKNIVLGR